MRRRDFLSASLALAGSTMLRIPGARPASAMGQITPGAPGWPSDGDWATLKQAVGGRLSPVVVPDVNDPSVRELLRDPFYVGDQPGLTESSGWLDAWRSEPSAYVVAAESASDVAAAIRFAVSHNLRLVVKSVGNSYLGASCAPGSLLIWTRHMNAITLHEAFTPQGSDAPPVPAVSTGGGCIWLKAYQAVTGGLGRYVQGSGCTTVGVAGLVQGGGFGSFSKAYGLAAGSLLEAEIVTADGEIRVVNHSREPDLFWALKGGGGGTFGVVTRVTLATHDLPETAGGVSLDLRARSDEAYRRLLARFVDLYRTNLFNPHWGEQAHARPDNRLRIDMVFQGLTEDEARAAWKPLIDFANANPDDYDGRDTLMAGALPAHFWWDADVRRRYAAASVVFSHRPGASPTDFWWAGDGGQVGVFWCAYSSAWLPATLLHLKSVGVRRRLVRGEPPLGRQPAFQQGPRRRLANCARSRPKHGDEPGCARCFCARHHRLRGAAGLRRYARPNPVAGGALRSRVDDAMRALRAAAPATGAYVYECDYFQPNWQAAFWGSNYSRLAEIKRRYDPDGLFFVHHGVGSEDWSPGRIYQDGLGASRTRPLRHPIVAGGALRAPSAPFYLQRQFVLLRSLK